MQRDEKTICSPGGVTNKEKGYEERKKERKQKKNKGTKRAERNQKNTTFFLL